MAVLTRGADPNAAAAAGQTARFWAGFCAAMVGFAVGICCLPYPPRVPFAGLADTDYIKAGWIYDRIVASPVPVDVAFLGTSHTMNGVDSARVEALLRPPGAAAGPHVVNLAVPHLGDDLHDLLARLLLAHKRPRVLVVELQQVPARAAHPAYARLAPARDILSEPLGNPDALTDILQLPQRAWRDFVAGLTQPTPDAAIPDHWDDTYRTVLHGGELSVVRDTAPPPEALARGAARARAQLDEKSAQYARLGWLTFRYNDWFLRHLLEDARAHGVRVALLYLPVFATTAPPAASWTAAYGPILTPPADVLEDPSLWFDTEHLNEAGSGRLAAWLAAALSLEFGDAVGHADGARW